MGEKSNEELLAELGVEAAPVKKSVRSPREERIIAGFEEIQRFVEQHERVPAHGEDKDIFERLYATRLDQIRSQEDCKNLVIELDHQGLLNDSNVAACAPIEFNSDEDLLAELGVEPPSEGDVTFLKHVKSRAEVRAAEEIANRKPCEDFKKFSPIFEAVQTELASGLREAKLLTRNASINQGDLFILFGQKAYVAEVGKEFVNKYDRKDSRLRVIYDNGTESDLLLRSLQRALDRDDAGRRIVDISPGPLFSGLTDEQDLASGIIYVLRSKSDHPTIIENRDVIHKIGVTGGTVGKRIANAKFDPTFLMADVDIVATYELYNINRAKLEHILHKFFDDAKLDIQINDRFGQPVTPREWFLVPLFIIDEVVEKIKDGSIKEYSYDKESVALIRELNDNHKPSKS